MCIFKHKQIHFFLRGKIKQSAPTPIMYVDPQRGRDDEVRSDVSSPDHRPITRKRHFFLQQKTDKIKILYNFDSLSRVLAMDTSEI